jgi:hypothetical protein
MKPNTPHEQQEILAAIKRFEPIQMNALSNTGINDSGNECGWLSFRGNDPHFDMLRYRVDPNYKPQQKESTDMTNKEKIAIIEAYERGEVVESRLVNVKHLDGLYLHDREWLNAREHAEEGIPQFNFYNYEYRIKPKATSGQRIRALADEYGLHAMTTQIVSLTARNQKRVQQETNDIYNNPAGPGNSWEVKFCDNGDVRFGCQFFKWEEIDAYAKEEGWWK